MLQSLHELAENCTNYTNACKIIRAVESNKVDDHHVKRLILLCIGLRHMWHSVSDSAHFEHALCPHRNATFHAFSRHIEQMCDSSSRSILYRSSISCAASIDSSRCRLISRPPANNTLPSQHNSCPQWHTVQPCYQTRNECSIYQVHVHCGQVRVHIQIRDCTILTQQYKITIRAATSTPSSILLEYFYYSGLIPLFTKYIMVKRQLTVSINPSTTPWETSQKNTNYCKTL